MVASVAKQSATVCVVKVPLVLYRTGGFVTIPDQVMGYADKASLLLLIDLTEHVIRLTDDLLIEFNDFSSNFPNYAKILINLKQVEHYGSVLSNPLNGTKKLAAIHAKSPEANYQSVSELFGMTVEQLKQRHTTGYENKS